MVSKASLFCALSKIHCSLSDQNQGEKTSITFAENPLEVAILQRVFLFLTFYVKYAIIIAGYGIEFHLLCIHINKTPSERKGEWV